LQSALTLQYIHHHGLGPLSTQEKPMHMSLKPLKKQLNSNDMPIPSVQCGGAHSHLALTISADNYLASTGVAFDAPVLPGPAPINAARSTAAQLTESHWLNSRNSKSMLLAKPTLRNNSSRVSPTRTSTN
jgi:hypothetical protein